MKMKSPEKEKIALLADHALFRGMSEDSIRSALVLLRAERRFLRRGETLRASYEKPDRFGIVLSGQIQAYADDAEGERMIFSTVGKGESFGEALCFLRRNESPVWLFAPEPSEVLLLSLSAFSGAGEKDGALLRELKDRFTSVLAARTLEMNRRIQILSKKSIRKKLLTLFSFYSQKAGDFFTLPLNREDMASYIGSDRSALSRELSRMKKEGVIDYYGKSFRVLPRSK